MQLSTGAPSSWTVQAPQCPSAQATFVPVRPRSSRSVSASVRPTGGSATSSTVPLTLRLSTTLRVRFRRRELCHGHLNARLAQGIASSGAAGHRQDVRQVDEPKRRAADDPLLTLVVDLGKHTPEVARSVQELADPLAVVLVAVPVRTGVQREPEHADRVRLTGP